METEKDETKSCMFYGFLSMCSGDRHDTFVELSDQSLSKIKDSSAKRQDVFFFSILNIYTVT